MILSACLLQFAKGASGLFGPFDVNLDMNPLELVVNYNLNQTFNDGLRRIGDAIKDSRSTPEKSYPPTEYKQPKETCEMCEGTGKRGCGQGCPVDKYFHDRYVNKDHTLIHDEVERLAWKCQRQSAKKRANLLACVKRLGGKKSPQLFHLEDSSHAAFAVAEAKFPHMCLECHGVGEVDFSVTRAVSTIARSVLIKPLAHVWDGVTSFIGSLWSGDSSPNGKEHKPSPVGRSSWERSSRRLESGMFTPHNLLRRRRLQTRPKSHIVVQERLLEEIEESEHDAKLRRR